MASVDESQVVVKTLVDHRVKVIEGSYRNDAVITARHTLHLKPVFQLFQL